jgi:hypothetical protein
MAVITLPADSTTLTLNGEIYRDMVEGDIITLTPVNPHSSHVNSVRGGVTIQGRSDSKVMTLLMNVTKFGEEDIRLNQALNGDGVVVFNGSCKTIFQSDGTDSVSSYNLENGSLTDQPTEVINTQDGNALMAYTILFRTVTRTL